MERDDLPSDEEVLSHVVGLDPDEAESCSFAFTVHGINELVAALDMTWDAMLGEKRQFGDAVRGGRSAEAFGHAVRFRIMKNLNEQLLEVRSRIWREKGWRDEAGVYGPKK